MTRHRLLGVLSVLALLATRISSVLAQAPPAQPPADKPAIDPTIVVAIIAGIVTLVATLIRTGVLGKRGDKQPPSPTIQASGHANVATGNATQTVQTIAAGATVGYLAGGNIRITQQIIQQSEEKARKQWRQLMIIEYPALQDDAQARGCFIKHLVGALDSTFANRRYIEFHSLLVVAEAEVEGQKVPVYHLIGHQIEFLTAVEKSYWGILGQSLSLEQREEHQVALNQRCNRLLNDGWKVTTKIEFAPSYLDLKCIYDAQSKTIDVQTLRGNSTIPANYSNKVTTTSELFSFLAALGDTPILDIGNLTFLETNYSLAKLIIHVLEKKERPFGSFRINANDYEEWDYLNPEFDEEMRVRRMNV